MQANKQYNYSKPYSSQHSSTMKAKRVGKKNANTRQYAVVIEEETEELGEKPFHCPLSGKSIH